MNKKQLIALSFVMVACMQSGFALPPTDPAELKSPRPGFVPGYMPRGTWVDSLALLPPPHVAGSAGQAADDAAYQASRAAMAGPKWLLAQRDAVLTFPKASLAFACALGVPISAETTPHLNMLLRRTLVDAGLATYKAKDFYQRQRPFVKENDATCTPDEESNLRKDGSYPSGHAAFGWAWGLVLAEVAPEQANVVLQRAMAFGQSRMICGAHWQSDVDAGRVVASAVVAQLHSNADFVSQLEAARKEVVTQKSRGIITPAADCELEAQALQKVTMLRTRPQQ